MYNHDLEKEAKERIKEIIMKMNGMSEDQLLDKYIHDVMFSKGFDILVRLYLDAKFK